MHIRGSSVSAATREPRVLTSCPAPDCLGQDRDLLRLRFGLPPRQPRKRRPALELSRGVLAVLRNSVANPKLLHLLSPDARKDGYGSPRLLSPRVAGQLRRGSEQHCAPRFDKLSRLELTNLYGIMHFTSQKGRVLELPATHTSYTPVLSSMFSNTLKGNTLLALSFTILLGAIWFNARHLYIVLRALDEIPVGSHSECCTSSTPSVLILSLPALIGYRELDFPSTFVPMKAHPYSARMIIDDTAHYAPDPADGDEWHALFPPGSEGFVRLGPQKRLFGVSMFHQVRACQLLFACFLELICIA